MISTLLALLLAASPGAGPIEGVWANEHNSVHVRFAACGALLCGTVVWASPKAIDDTRRGGGGALIGTQVFRDMRAAGPNRWRGGLFVPDIGMTFRGVVALGANDRVTGRGCLFGGLFCKSTVWTRVR